MKEPLLELTKDQNNLDMDKCIAYVSSPDCKGSHKITFNQLMQITEHREQFALVNDYFPSMYQKAKKEAEERAKIAST